MLTPSGNIRYQLKTPYSDGTTHVIFEPLDFIAKLVALVTKPRVNLTRFHGVFAPNSKHRVDVTSAKRGKGRPHDEHEEKTPEQQHKAMSWAQRLKRVFKASAPAHAPDLHPCRPHRCDDLSRVRRRSQGDCVYRRSGSHRQNSPSPHEERRITATTGATASNTGLAWF